MSVGDVYVDRRVAVDDYSAGYFAGGAHLRDVRQAINIVKIFSGNWHVSQNGDEMLSTILGSCVSVCIRDPVIGVGGMNHFLLPGQDAGENGFGASARYGAYAMECLINGMLDAGAKKDRFEIKLFGGGNIMNTSARIGTMNAKFIRGYMRREGYRIASEDMEGELPRRLHYYPASGRVMLRHLRRMDDLAVIEEEERYTKRIKAAPIEGTVELF